MKSKKTIIKSEMNKNDIRSLDLAGEKGGIKLVERYAIEAISSTFRDGIALRYGWDPVIMPSICAGNEKFTVAHALQCPKRGYTHKTKTSQLLCKLLSHGFKINSTLTVARGNLCS